MLAVCSPVHWLRNLPDEFISLGLCWGSPSQDRVPSRYTLPNACRSCSHLWVVHLFSRKYQLLRSSLRFTSSTSTHHAVNKSKPSRCTWLCLQVNGTFWLCLSLKPSTYGLCLLTCTPICNIVAEAKLTQTTFWQIAGWQWLKSQVQQGMFPAFCMGNSPCLQAEQVPCLLRIDPWERLTNHHRKLTTCIYQNKSWPGIACYFIFHFFPSEFPILDHDTEWPRQADRIHSFGLQRFVHGGSWAESTRQHQGDVAAGTWGGIWSNQTRGHLVEGKLPYFPPDKNAYQGIGALLMWCQEVRIRMEVIIPARGPKQCVVRIRKGKVERTQNQQW